jgi:putative DNA primase/helicase
VSACRPNKPYIILEVGGEQGSGKSFLCDLIAQTIDPRSAKRRKPPKDDRTLAAAARTCGLMTIDNLSWLSRRDADDLARLATGAGLGSGKLYSDYDEAVFEAARPIVINGIADAGSACSDQQDPALVIHLPSIEKTRRRTEAEILAQFEARRSRILGALMDALSVGVCRLPDVKSARLPRMADCAKWTLACSPGLGFTEDEFHTVLADDEEDKASRHSMNRQSIPRSQILPRPVSMARRRTCTNV